MHPTQLEILDSLKQNTSREFKELMRDTAETSDNLTHQLKQLVKRDFVETKGSDEYALTQKALTYLNNNLEVNHDLFPTLSCMLELHNTQGEVLVVRKPNQPFQGSLHLPMFGVVSSKSLEYQIRTYLEQYRIKGSHLTFKLLHRERVLGDDNLYVSDKFFVVFHGTFTTFEENIENHEFLVMIPDALASLPETLNATKDVLTLKGNPGYIETTQSQPHDIEASG